MRVLRATAWASLVAMACGVVPPPADAGDASAGGAGLSLHVAPVIADATGENRARRTGLSHRRRGARPARLHGAQRRRPGDRDDADRDELQPHPDRRSGGSRAGSLRLEDEDPAGAHRCRTVVHLGSRPPGNLPDAQAREGRRVPGGVVARRCPVGRDRRREGVTVGRRGSVVSGAFQSGRSDMAR